MKASSNEKTDQKKMGEPISQPLFEVISGPMKGTRFMLMGEKIAIGRTSDNDICLNHPRISRYHAALLRLNDRWELRDLGSQNGVLVNQERVSKQELRIGDVVTLGEIDLRFSQGFASTEPSNSTASANTASGSEFFAVPTPPEALDMSEPVPAFTPAYAFPTGDLSQWQGREARWPLRRILLWGGGGLALGIFAVTSLTRHVSESKTSGILFSTATEIGESSASDTETDLFLNPPQIEEGMGNEREINFVLADQTYQKGLRELGAKSWHRALDDFEAALTLYPNHQLAGLRLEETRKLLQEAIEKNFRLGRSYLESLKYTLAIYHFSQTLQLLGSQKDSPLYNEAIQFIEVAKSRMKQ